MIWQEPKAHSSNCYFCIMKASRYNKKNKFKIEYTSSASYTPSAPVSRNSSSSFQRISLFGNTGMHFCSLEKIEVTPTTKVLKLKTIPFVTDFSIITSLMIFMIFETIQKHFGAVSIKTAQGKLT